MPSTALKVAQLRLLLADRFGATSLPSYEVCRTGLPVLDDLQVPRGAITELVSRAEPGRGGGVSLLLYALLRAWLTKERAILVDGRDTFAPKGLRQEELNRLLWLRCYSAAEAMKTADLVVRDGNLPLVIMLLTLNSRAELRRVPTTAWHRLQRLAEKSGATLLVLTAEALISCARLRLSVGGGFPLANLHRLREELPLSVREFRQMELTSLSQKI